MTHLIIMVCIPPPYLIIKYRENYLCYHPPFTILQQWKENLSMNILKFPEFAYLSKKSTPL